MLQVQKHLLDPKWKGTFLGKEETEYGVVVVVVQLYEIHFGSIQDLGWPERLRFISVAVILDSTSHFNLNHEVIQLR